MPSPVVELMDVSKQFKSQIILKNVTFSIDQGHCYGLTGPNGSGKSVLLYLMCGLMRPDSGQVVIDPSLLSKDRTFPDRFGVSINDPAYLPGLTAMQNLLQLAAIRKRASEEECAGVLDSVGLDPSSRQRARHFSLGMKQKLSLAQALIESPEVLLLDEPFNALDKESVVRVTAVLQAKIAEGVTVVMTSHRAGEIASLCDKTLNISEKTIGV